MKSFIEKPKITFTTLPEFVIYEIVSRLDIIDRMNLKATCKRMLECVGKRADIGPQLTIISHFVKAELKGDVIVAISLDHHLKMYDAKTLDVTHNFTEDLDIINDVNYPIRSHFQVQDRYAWIHHMELIDEEECFLTRLYDCKKLKYMFGYEDPSYGDLGTWKVFDPKLKMFYGITYINVVPQLFVVKDDNGMQILDYPLERDLYYCKEILLYDHYLILANYDYYAPNLIFVVDLNTVSIVCKIKIYQGRRRRQYFNVEAGDSYPLIKVSSQYSRKAAVYNILTGELTDFTTLKKRPAFPPGHEWFKFINNGRLLPKFPFGNFKSVEVMTQRKRSGRLLVHGNIQGVPGSMLIKISFIFCVRGLSCSNNNKNNNKNLD